MMRRPQLAAAIAAALTLVSFGQTYPPVYFSVPPADAPELAHRGNFKVGVRTLDVTNPGQIDILNAKDGKAPTYDRPLRLEIWYPATLGAGQEERTVYTTPMPGAERPGVPKSFDVLGKAARDAAPAQGGPFPLVVLSHGYPGSRIFLSYLGENLASKGYVAVSIDHTDSVFGAVKPFPSTLLNRSNDQLFTIAEVERQSKQAGNFLNGLVDASKTAIVGYSMGGYGALATAGAGYSKASMAMKFVPGGYFEDWTAGSPKFESRPRGNIKAMVAIAPWGMQPPYNSWDDVGLSGIRIPSLFIAGDRDDVSDYEKGIKRAFEKAVNSDRCMLVYENALHNTGGNPPPPEALGDFVTRTFFDEPVWRKDRIAAINQHFITAFLDLHLKGDQSRSAYLKLAVPKANDTVWPLPPGASAGAAYSDGSGKGGVTYWKGFQRRWALGLEFHCMAGAGK